jgi:LysM domain
MVAPIVWIGGALAASGAGLMYYRSKTHQPADGQNMPGGQTVGNIDAVNAFSATIENQSLGFDAYPIDYAAGPSISFIDQGFFGAGPQSAWFGRPADYADVFADYRGDPNEWERRHNRGGRGAYRFHGRDRFGRERTDEYSDHRPGAGGFGRHRPRWNGESPPSGGEGYENDGQNYIGFGGGPARGAGMPWQQQTTMGTSGQDYRIQQGDSLTGIASKFWGDGSSYQGLQAANNNLGGYGGNDQLPVGGSISIPGAPQSGPPAPGGPAGNGIGGGSVGANGYNAGISGADPSAGPGQAYPGAGTASAGASGGGSPSAGQSGGNSSRTRLGNASTNYAVGGGQSGVQTKGASKKPTTQAPARNRPSAGRKK